MKRKYFWFLTVLLGSFFFSSCTLFVDEYDDLPRHTGEGYDKPITENENGVEVTYQFNDNVRVLDQQEQQHIASVEADATNLFMQVDFNENTPDNLLPRKGEILVSKVSEHFPYGASHHVKSVKRIDGKYRCLLEYAQLDETFKELDMNGQMMLQEEGEQEYYVATRAADGSLTQTRAGDDMDEGFSFNDGKLSFTLPFNLSYSGQKEGQKGTILWSISMEKEKNYTRSSYEFNFDGFSVREKKYNLKIIQTDEEVLDIKITGGVEKGGIIKKWRPVRSKTCAFGYVVVVFFVNIDISWSAKVEGSVNIIKKKKTITTHHIDLLHPSAYRKEIKVAENDWNLGAAISGSIIFTPKVTIGIGLYTKVFTARLEPYFEFGIESSFWEKTFFDEDDNDINIAKGPSVEIVARLCLQVRFVVDFSFKSLLGPVYDQVEDLAKLIEFVDDEAFYKELNTEADLIEENNSVTKFRDTYYTFQKNFNIHPRIAFEAYTKLKGYGFKPHDDFALAKIGESRVMAGFTERGNVTRIIVFGDDE